MKRASRKPLNLSESLHQRLNSYALAASAAGVGVLALVQPAEAKIIYTPTHKVLHGSFPAKTLHLDLNSDGIVDFTLSDVWFVDQDFGTVGRLYLSPAQANGGMGHRVQTGGTVIISALRAGARIGRNGRFFSNTGLPLVMCDADPYGHSGRWCNVGDRYLGLRFVIKGTIHYGWARLNATTSKDARITATLTGYAYETIPNKPIIAGKTKGKDVITLAPASLGHLARGASAIPTWSAKSRIGSSRRHYASALKRGARIGAGNPFIKGGAYGETARLA